MILSALTYRILLYAVAVLLLRLVAYAVNSFRTRQWLFLVASYVFYASWGPGFLAILVFSSLMNYALGNHLRRRITPGRLWLGIGFNLLLLCFFKYLPLIGGISTSNPVAAKLGHIVLPLGISFWTFQAISYLLDLYREEDLDPSLLEFCLYMAFWPTVISGPVCRLPNLLPQFRQPRGLSWEDIGKGTQRVLTGIFMMAVSQLLAVGLSSGQGVDGGFARAANSLGGMDVWCLVVAYGFQLFFDFAGYSHIVIGIAEIFSIRLQENFNRPYLSTTPSVFWTRWHMSLSFWIRDYLFFPLAMLRREIWWRNASLVISMFIFGLWHKGSLLFMLWGIYQGFLLVLHRQWQQLQLKWEIRMAPLLLTPLSWLVTFGAISLGWIFFRAESKQQAATMFKTVLSPASYTHTALPLNFYGLILLAMAGYFAVIGMAAWLDRQALPGQSAVSSSGATDYEPARGGVLAILARDRWVWVIPIAVVLTMYVLLFLRQSVPLLGPMMYQIF